MSISKQRAAALIVGIAWAIGSGAPAFADDTEIFFVDPSNITAQPNILFIFDNSGSMDDRVVSQTPYEPATTYAAAGGCGTGRVYWSTSGGANAPVPACTGNDNWFNRSAFKCKAATDQFAAGAEKFRGRMEQYDNTGAAASRKWRAISATEKTRTVECKNDAGLHSDGVNVKLFARDGNASAYGDASQEISWTNTQTSVWDSNYLNWYYGPTGNQRKIDIVKAVAKNMLNSIDGVNVGLMTYNDREGGHVDYALEDIATSRANMVAQIDALQPGGYTPLSETLYEAYSYMSGKKLVYGDVGPILSADASRTAAGGATYKSPLEEGCQKNFIVYLSDGLPTQDRSSDSDIASLVGGTCDGTASDGYCLDDLAEYMGTTPKGHDVNTTVPGDQRVTTYTIGFDLNVPILDSAAKRSGGAYFEANNAASLTTALTSILFNILSESSTFTAPAVSVNSFNRTRNLNDLFISVFTATGDAHWPGNLKKYKLSPTDGKILDANGADAVDPATGFFAKGTQSYWSATLDEDSVVLGGAASRLPLPVNRKVYTNVSNGDLNDVANAVTRGNAALTDAVLNTGQAGGPTRDEVVDFMRGLDKTGALPRNEMGDPLHAQPASVTYDANKTLIYFVTNDGYLHAINTQNGVEEWAFIPREFLDDQVDLYLNEAAETRHYGIDGSPRVQMIADNDGVIEPGEKVYLFFGMRRGGDFYYGLDITDPTDPQVMWRLPGSGSQALPENGQSWSTPVPTRMDIQGSGQSAGKLVLVFGAGYDVKHDDYNMSGVDTSGKGIFIVDSVTGNVLWRGANVGATGSVNRTFANMNYSIPGDIKAIDLNTDGYADRMYAADMGGQVWRFDVFNGQAAGSLVTGGVIAQLGGAPSATPSITDTRRFYYSPDVALVSADQPFIHIGVGSGHRERPNSVFNTDRFYALRDYATFSKLTQAQYNAITPITDAQLEDITNDTARVMPAGSPGWKLTLVHPGEKVLAEARTFNNQVFFTSFEPGAGAGGNTTNCKPALGTNRLYTVSLFNGAPVNNLDASTGGGPLTETDRYRTFQGSLASEVVFIFPSPDDPNNCVGDQCTPPPIACVDLFCFPPGFANNPVRTFWSEEAID